jgi:hypothetical protein
MHRISLRRVLELLPHLRRKRSRQRDRHVPVIAGLPGGLEGGLERVHFGGHGGSFVRHAGVYSIEGLGGQSKGRVAALGWTGDPPIRLT